MKTQNFGTAPEFGWRWPFKGTSLCQRGYGASLALKNYKVNRENGNDTDSPQIAFPTHNFENLDVTDEGWDTQSGRWPDSNKRFWYKLTLKDGSINTDFYYQQKRRYKDNKGNPCRAFLIGHRDGTRITGFTQRPNYDEGYPRIGGCYYEDFVFNGEQCLSIRQWMESKDCNYLKRLYRENPALFETKMAELIYANSKHHAVLKYLTYLLYQPLASNTFQRLHFDLQLIIFEYVVAAKLDAIQFRNTINIASEKWLAPSANSGISQLHFLSTSKTEPPTQLLACLQDNSTTSSTSSSSTSPITSFSRI
ncbi:MAG: hypothetical protein K0R24_1596 [Gammaproteobacteria bacterium]|jgi:hypothetical protein|nr:hypothetical protein [Gammaproteobacteria bacterium]